jgi:DNA repair protein RadD
MVKMSQKTISHFNLRPYQEQAIQSVLGKAFSLLVLATGSGKSVIMSEIIRRHKCKTLILVNKNILVENAERYVDAKVYHASSGRKEFGEITIACYQSLIRSKNIPDFDLLLIDEFHLFDLEKLEFIKRKKTIGFTATPLGYKEADFVLTVKDLTPEHLVPIVYTGKKMIDLSNVKSQNGEYKTKDLEIEYEQKNQEIADKIKQIDRKFIVVICISIDHCELMASLLGAYVCHSKRNQRLDFEKSGGIMCTVVMVSTGYDFPAIDCIVFARATRSPVFYVQCVGRGLRKHEGKKDLLLVDFGRVVENLGSVYDIDFLNIEKKVPKPRLCPMCEKYSDNKVRVCPCGLDFIPNPVKRGAVKFNLETHAYDGTVPIAIVYAVKHRSKAGNDCIKITYHKNIFETVATEYVLPFNKGELFRQVGALNEGDFFARKLYKKIIGITTKFDGKYLQVKERFV